MYEKELVELSKAEVRYLVVGGIGVTLSGYPQLTHDLDLFIDLNKGNLSKLIKIMEKMDYVPRVPVKPEELLDPKKRKLWNKEKHMMVFSFYNTKHRENVVDLLIYEPLNFEECYDRRRVIKINGQDVNVANPRDLLKMKQKASRVKDLNHINILEQIIQREEMKKKDD